MRLVNLSRAFPSSSSNLTDVNPYPSHLRGDLSLTMSDKDWGNSTTRSSSKPKGWNEGDGISHTNANTQKVLSNSTSISMPNSYHGLPQ